MQKGGRMNAPGLRKGVYVFFLVKRGSRSIKKTGSNKGGLTTQIAVDSA